MTSVVKAFFSLHDDVSPNVFNVPSSLDEDLVIPVAGCLIQVVVAESEQNLLQQGSEMVYRRVISYQ